VKRLNAGRDIVACRRPVSSGGNKPIKLEGIAVSGPLSEIKYNQYGNPDLILGLVIDCGRMSQSGPFEPVLLPQKSQ
jgi:hypothetical protein